MDCFVAFFFFMLNAQPRITIMFPSYSDRFYVSYKSTYGFGLTLQIFRCLIMPLPIMFMLLMCFQVC